MRVVARDSEVTDHLVAVQTIAVGPEEYEISCAEYERVVMCPAWTLGETFGPGRHRWSCPSPQFPAVAYFVRTAPIHVPFDMATTFVIPNKGRTVRLTACGSLQARCSDVTKLIAQFVALPVDGLGEGIVRSVTRSVERMLARLLTRRVVRAGMPAAVTDLAELPAILAELASSNPTAGAVYGVEVMHVDQLVIAADDGTPDDSAHSSQTDVPTEKIPLSMFKKPVTSERAVSAAGEIVVGSRSSDVAPTPEWMPPPRTAFPALADDITHPDLKAQERAANGASDAASAERNTIIGIGMSHIGTDAVADAAPSSNGISPGTRVLVPDLRQTATVRQHQRGYYELEITGSEDTIWVPATEVVPE